MSSFGGWVTDHRLGRLVPLETAPHILGLAPPGTGKTEFAHALAEAARAEGYCHGSFVATASADWITMGIDGQYAFLSSADVVDVKTKKVVAQMKDEYGKPMHSEKYLEMSFSAGKLMRTVSQFGQGIPSAVQARLAGRAVTAKTK